MPTLVRTNQTKADLLQRKLEIDSELRELRNHYDKPGVVEVPGDRQRVDDLIARHTPGDARCFRDQRDHVHATPRFPSCGPSSWMLSVRSPANRFTRATHLILSPLAWGCLLAALDTAGRPLFAVGGSENGMNAMGTAQGGGAGYDVNGRTLGCDVVISGNVPANLGSGSNEIRIIAADMRDVYLRELPASPIFIRAEQPNAASLGILYVAYSYSAFSAGRQPKAMSAVSGTGMILPAL